jgi:beta-phosphoglucomutase-like phosphatase (HAD superfamily)
VKRCGRSHAHNAHLCENASTHPLPSHRTGTTLQRTPGLTEFIAWLRSRGVRLAAVTNAPRANTEMMLAALKLDDAFEVG